VTPDPADLLREPNADYERGVREERRRWQQMGHETPEDARRFAMDCLDRVLEASEGAERECWRKVRECWRKAMDAALVNLPEEPPR